MTANKDAKIGGLLLAAGGSSRLGQPKQLIRFDGKTLIRRSAEMLTACSYSPVIAVLGAEIGGCMRELDGLDLSICINDEWTAGISLSIKAGLRQLLDISPDIDAALIALCDQPFVTADDYEGLATRFAETRAPIVASAYDEVIGAPAIFARELFDRLFELEGDQGARFLIRQNSELTIPVTVEGAGLDIDTSHDLRVLIIK